ncbi:MAG: protease modulator HflK, partial [Isosphaeraceae bacterium]|nr:protease modulator HflK [Isosphaeraceae bacterium]
VLAESRKAPAATRRRLYLEALAELLPRFGRTVIVEPGKDLDLSLFSEEPGRGAEATPRASGSAPDPTRRP